MPIYLSVTRKLLTESDTYLSDPRVKEKPANEDEEMVTDFKVRKAVEKLADAGRVSVAEIALEKQVHLHSGSAFMQFSRLLLDQYEESPDEYEAINYGQTCMIVAEGRVEEGCRTSLWNAKDEYLHIEAMVKLFERIDPAKLDVDAFEWMCAGNNDWKDVLLAGQDYCRLDRPADMEKCRGHAPQMPPIGYRFLVPPDAATAPPAANNKTV